jgi:hypothetical protein
MKKKVIITESQYKRIILEQGEYTEQLLLLINSGDKTNIEMVKELTSGLQINLSQFISDNIDKIKIEPPYFKNMELLGVTDPKNRYEVLRYIFGNDIRIIDNMNGTNIHNLNGDRLYLETPYNSWIKSEYDSNNNLIYWVNNSGTWVKVGYDDNGKQNYYEDSTGEIVDNRNITESKVIKEQFDSVYLKRVSSRLEPPYFYNLREHFGVGGNKNIEEVLKYIYGDDITIYGSCIVNPQDNIIYNEYPDERWYKIEYDGVDNVIYFENSEGRIEDYRKKYSQEEENISEEEEITKSTVTKWEDLVTVKRGPANPIDNTPWNVEPTRGPGNQLT